MSCQRVPSCQPPASAAPLASRPRGTREQPQSHTIQTPTPTAGPAAELPVSRGSQSRDNQQRYTCIAQFCRLGVGTQADRLGADWSGERKMAGEDILYNDARDHPTSLRRPAAMGPGVHPLRTISNRHSHKMGGPEIVLLLLAKYNGAQPSLRLANHISLLFPRNLTPSCSPRPGCSRPTS